MHQRTEHIRLLEAAAQTLLATMTHKTMKVQVAIALADLHEASHYMQVDDIRNWPSVLAIADVAMLLAASRLAKINIFLRMYGPNAHVRDQG